MSTHPIHESDSEDDDYVPPLGADSDSSEDERESKRPRTSSPPPQQVEAEKKKARDALWASFQASLTAPPSNPEPAKVEMVKIEKRFKFAGELVVEVVDVPADSDDAKKWPPWHAPGVETTANPLAAGPSILPKPLGEPMVSESSSSTKAKPPAKRPGPRKPKVSLAAIPTASSQKAKKLSTLEKSAMDWRAHVQASEEAGLKDELDANRRGGGYLEKVEFLNRVEERREDVFEASKGSKRRRPL